MNLGVIVALKQYTVWEISQLDVYGGPRPTSEYHAVKISAENIQVCAEKARRKKAFIDRGVKEFIIVERGRDIRNGGPLTLNVSGKKIKRKVTVIEGIKRPRFDIEEDIDYEAIDKMRSEVRMKLSNKYRATKKMWSEPGHRERISMLGKERWENPEFRAKVTKNMKIHGADPVFRSKMSIYAKKRWENPEYRDRMSKMMLEKWKDPEHRKKVKESFNATIKARNNPG